MYGPVDLVGAKKLIASFAGSEELRFFVGTDSDARDGRIIFATVLVAYKVGKGATYFYTTKRVNRHYDMSSRLLEETHLSIEMATLVRELFGFDNTEVHLDIGYNGASRDVLSSAVGYVKGMGFSFKLKPWAFAATKVAHRHTK
ncbi:MAG: ribonuclease H-like YkuK family protein [Thermotogaceae bacterium]|nr:ribonuclease H-like YkuK family protein [Thermotogaceae bacterium]